MKKIVFLLVVVFLLGCDSENADNCLKTSGSIIQQEVSVSAFTKINVGHRVQLIVQQGAEQQVILETGKNLAGNITIEVIDDRLVITDKNNCNLFRDFGISKVFVTSPNISEIRNSSGLTIESRGVLRYPNLTLLSEEPNNGGNINTDGDFELAIEVENFHIVANNISNFFITGSATNANIGLFSGDSRFEGANFIIQDLIFFHRSTNKMFVNPQRSIRGEIRSGGDVIAVFRPPVVEVEEFYTGRLIFE
ncbi:MAG: DUF2807 domain-containing protein [Bacteroidetes bacterium HGW-Bacteroidetes-2]|jgi:hypothetical protein|nr:MAG: DUF2807 domain-containing protein [Bacteroidetes bacterium HGW-Bacteroidetes-2]